MGDHFYIFLNAQFLTSEIIRSIQALAKFARMQHVHYGITVQNYHMCTFPYQRQAKSVYSQNI